MGIIPQNSFRCSHPKEKTVNKHFARRLALAVAACFSWSLALAASARAITARPPAPPSRTWVLSAKEMQRIVGASAASGGDTGGGFGAGGTSDNAGASPGPIQSWVGSAGDVNTLTGAKLTTVPVVGWNVIGGMRLQYNLYHSSLSTYANSPSNPKWTVSYSSQLGVWNDNSGNVTAYWDNQSTNSFSHNMDGSYTRPAGIHDTLIKNGNGSYDIVTKDQIDYYFGFYSYTNGTVHYFLSSISDKNGNTIQVVRNADGSLYQIVDPNGRRITITADNSGSTIITDPLGRQWKITYTPSGQLTYLYLPALPNDPTPNYHFGYDSNNNINAFGLLDGKSSSAIYNPDSTVSSETDPCGNVTRFGYTQSGPGNGTATITAPNNVASVHTYVNGRLDHVTDALNNTEYYIYDTDNNKTQVQDKRGHLWNYSYDGMGNRLTAQDPYTHQTTMTYNADNKPLTVKLPRGRNVLLTYDTHDNLRQVDQKDINKNVLATTYFTIGSYGLVSDKYDANNHHYHYDYDANGNLKDEQRPSGNSNNWGYDGLGVLKSRENSLGHTDYTLDAWERTTAISYVNNSQYNSTFGYDERGDLTHFSNYAGNYDRYYDDDGRMKSEYRNNVIQVSHIYDSPGEQGLLSQTNDITNRAINYGYTGRNQLAWVNDGSGGANYGYDANGNLNGISNGNGTTVTKGYDNDDNLTSLNNYYSNNNAIATFIYGYNEDSQRVSESDNSGYANYTWGYNSLGQMTSEARTGAFAYTNTYAYDNVGNRTSDNINGRPDTLTLDADDQLKTFANNGTAFNYTYDGNGNQKTRVYGVPYTLNYDLDDNLMNVSSANGTVYYAYDATGRRTSRQVGGVTTAYQYDGSQMLTETGPSTSQYLWGPGGLVRRDGEWPTTDGLGNTRVVTNGSQSITSTQLPDAYGQSITSSGSTSLPYQWGGGSGYRSDLDAGLIQVGARYYDRDSGRFITRDSDLNQAPYAYCGGDPINCTDPSGHSFRVNGWTAIGAFFGLALGIVLVVAFAPEVVVAGVVVTGASEIFASTGITGVLVSTGVSLAGGALGADAAEVRDKRDEESRDPHEPVASKGGMPGSAGFGITTSFSADPTQILQPLQTPNPRNW